MAKKIELSTGAYVDIYSETLDAKGIVLIFPGGAYQLLAPREDYPIAKVFMEAGYDAATINYTVRNIEDEKAPTLLDLPLREAGEALNRLKELYPEKRVICIGFSAGAHLAASAVIHGKERGFAAVDALILAYPVITMGEFTNIPTHDNLVGTDAGYAEYFSLEKKVHGDMPPVFVWHTREDPDVPVQNSLLFTEALLKHGIPFEYHIYPYGVHGLSLATPEVDEPEKGRLSDPHVAQWMDNALEWLNYLSVKR